MQRELFGPILTVFAARDFSHALEVANTSDFALTGAVYSRSPRHLRTGHGTNFASAISISTAPAPAHRCTASLSADSR